MHVEDIAKKYPTLGSLDGIELSALHEGLKEDCQPDRDSALWDMMKKHCGGQKGVVNTLLFEVFHLSKWDIDEFYKIMEEDYHENVME